MTKSAIAKHSETLTDEVAEDLHVDHLYGSEPNGHVLMTNVNTANFDRSYYVYMNDVMTGHVDEVPGKELKNVSIENMPLASMANEVSARAEYEDKDTKLTFHSRTGKSEFTLSETLVAPNEITLEGQFVAERFNEETNKWLYGIYVKGLDIQYVKENLHGYSDFSFYCGSRTDSWQQRHQEDLQGNRDMLQLGPGRRLVELPASGCVIQHCSRVYPRCG